MTSTPQPKSIASSSRDGSQPGPIEASPAEAQAAPFPKSMPVVLPASHPLAARGFDESAAPSSPRVSTSHARVTLAGKDTSLAGLPASFLSDDPCLSAQRAMGIC